MFDSDMGPSEMMKGCRDLHIGIKIKWYQVFLKEIGLFFEIFKISMI